MKTDPGETGPSTVLPDPACGGTPMKEEVDEVKEEDQEQNISKDKEEEKEKTILKQSLGECWLN